MSDEKLLENEREEIAKETVNEIGSEKEGKQERVETNLDYLVGTVKEKFEKVEEKVVNNSGLEENSGKQETNLDFVAGTVKEKITANPGKLFLILMFLQILSCFMAWIAPWPGTGEDVYSVFGLCSISIIFVLLLIIPIVLVVLHIFVKPKNLKFINSIALLAVGGLIVFFFWLCDDYVMAQADFGVGPFAYSLFTILSFVINIKKK